MTASGTAGHSTEFEPYLALDRIGAVVVKSLRHEPWSGNPAPRLHPTPAGMLNSVGLQGPGVKQWLDRDLPSLIDAGATVVASIWGTTVEDYHLAAEALNGAPTQVVAVEVNLSCPNHHARNEIFAHSPALTSAAIEVAKSAGRPIWAKLSPNVTHVWEIAEAAVEGGASAVTIANTMIGLAIDVEDGSLALGGGGGGLSGAAIGPIALREVYDCRRHLRDLPIIGVGGITTGRDAIAMIMAGASAVQVGTASFVDPGAVGRIQDEMEHWCVRHGVGTVSELVGKAHVTTHDSNDH